MAKKIPQAPGEFSIPYLAKHGILSPRESRGWGLRMAVFAGTYLSFVRRLGRLAARLCRRMAPSGRYRFFIKACCIR